METGRTVFSPEEDDLQVEVVPFFTREDGLEVLFRLFYRRPV